jgi:ABC-type nitrate/sulfonate/bicarbonate transport system substrate-binding protein
MALLYLLLASLLPAQEIQKIKIGYSGTGITQYALELPKRLGIFKKNGLDPEIVYVGSGSLLNQALVAGTFDLSLSQGSEAMVAKLQGVDQRIVASIANRFNHVYLTHPSITSLKQLRGKRVAVSRFGSGSHFITNLVLKEAGLDPEKDVTVFQVGNSSSRLAAIMAGSVDGSIMAADFIPRAKKEGFNVLVDLAESKIDYPFLTFIMMSPQIDRNLRMVKAVIKSMSEGIRVFQTDRKAAKEIIKIALRTDDPETLDFAVERSARVLERRPFPTVAGINMVLEELSPKNPKAKSAKFEDFVDLRALKELEQEGLFK